MQRHPPLIFLLLICILSQSMPSFVLVAQAERAAFLQSRGNTGGRTTLPAAEISSPQIENPVVNQSERLALLRQRWAREQQLDPASPPSKLTELYLPLVRNHVSAPGPTQPVPGPQELAQYRTANSTVYAYPDGRLETRVYAQPIHYQAVDGSWQPYAPKLVSIYRTGDTTPIGYRAIGTDLDVTFGSRAAVASDNATITLAELRDGALTLKLGPIRNAPSIEVEADSVRYDDVWSGSELRYEVVGSTVIQTINLTSAPSSDFVPEFWLDVAGGNARRDQDILHITGADGETRLGYSAPYMVDARGTISTAIRITLNIGSRGMTTLRYEPDAAWLAAPERAYPVTLSNTIGPLGRSGDTYVAENPPADLDHHTEAQLYTGYSVTIGTPRGRSRSFINFDLPALPPGVSAADIINANLSLYMFFNERGGPFDLDLYATSDPWSEIGMRWGTQPGRTAFVSRTNVNAGLGRKIFLLTTLAQNWYATPAPHARGIALLAGDEGQAAGLFASGACPTIPLFCNNSGATSDAVPYLSINYSSTPVGRGDLQLTESLTFVPDDPATPPLQGTSVTARFKLRNTSGEIITIPTLQVRMRGPSGASYDFPAVNGLALAPGEEYTYSQSRSLPEGGFYFGQAQFNDGTNWYRIAIPAGSGLVNARSLLLRSTLPPPDDRTQGPNAPSGYAGEPVNTATGNFVSSWVDATVLDTGLSLVLGRTFNSLDTNTLGLFGYGWASTYDQRVIRREDESVVLQRSDGQRVYFSAEFAPAYAENRAADGYYDAEINYQPTGRYITEDGFDLTLSRDLASDAWTLIDREMTTQRFNADGRLTSITDRYGTAVVLSYTGTLLKRVATARQGCDFVWVGDRVTSIACPIGTLTYRYDALGDLVEVVGLDGKTIRYTYINHRISQIVDGDGRLIVENRYNLLGRVTAQREGITPWTSFSYAGAGRTTTFTDARGSTLTDTYDVRDRLVRRVDTLGNANTYAYDSDDRVISYTNALSATWLFAYDSAGNLRREVDPLGATWVYTYSLRNQQTAQTNPLGQTTIYTYSSDLLIAEQNPLGGVRSYINTPAGLVLTTTDELGRTFGRTYTPQGQIASEADPLGHTTSFTYSPAGDLSAVTDALNQRAQYEYDERRRLVRIIDPLGGETRFAYDAMGNLVREVNALGETRELFYDGNNRLIGEVAFDGAVTDYFYDEVGNLVRIVDALGGETRLGYDAINRLTSRTNRLGATWSYEYDAAGRLRFERDPLGRVVEHRYDPLGRETETINARGYSELRSYDLLGRPREHTSRLGATTRYAYDALGRIVTETDGLGAATSYSFDAVGQPIRVTDALGLVTRFTYDRAGRPVRQIDRMGATINFAYDAVGRLTSRIDQRGGVTRMRYDALDRLIEQTDAIGGNSSFRYDALGRRIAETDPRGATRTWRYDPMGREIVRIDRTGARTSTSYDPLGRVTEVVNALGYARSMTYDAEGQLLTESDERGATTSYTYDGVGNRRTRNDPRNAQWRFEFDENNNLVLEIDPLGNTTSSTFDAGDNPIRTTDALGNSYETHYDILARTIGTRDPSGATTATSYDALGRVIERVDPRGARTTYTYDAEGRIVAETDALGNTAATRYDAAGAPVEQVDRRGGRTRTDYDLLGRAVATSDALGNSWRSVYDPAGNLIQRIDPRGATTTYAYDAEGRMLAQTDALGHIWRSEYDPLGRVVRSSDPLGNTTLTEYDPAGNVVRTVLPGGQAGVAAYDAAGNQIAQTDARGFVTTTEHDPLGRPIRVTNALGHVTTTHYDALGRVVEQVDPLGRTTTMVYDSIGRLTSITDPLGATVVTNYDVAGSPIAMVNPNGSRTRTDYDLLGRPVARSDALGNTTRLVYDPAGNLVEELRPNGGSIRTRYDALNRPVAATLSSGPAETATYDVAGNIVARAGGDGVQSLEYDLLGRLVRRTDVNGLNIGMTYDAAGRRTALTYPDGRVVRTSYDANSRPIAVDDGRGHTTALGYDNDGRLTDVEYPASAMRMAYDATGRLTGVLNEDAGGAFAVYAYTLDAAGNRLVEEIRRLQVGAPTTIERSSYTYDANDRLIRSSRSVAAQAPEVIEYGFDLSGNRLSAQSSAGWSQVHRYDVADRLLELTDTRTGATTYAYDEAGQRIEAASATGDVRYSYDTRGRMLELKEFDRQGGAQLTQTMIYDSLGRRAGVEQRDDAGRLQLSERTVYDGDGWSVLGDLEQGGAERWFVPHPQGLGHLSVEESGATRFAHTDGLGSYIGYTDVSGRAPASGPTRYTDWGQIEAGGANLSGGYGYTGHRHDAGELIYARNRFYDPASATFLTADPFPPQATLPGGLNRYSYVRGNPINRTDPLGLFDWSTGTVQRGDTLWAIAQGAGTTVERLLQLNPHISNPSLIHPGQRISTAVSSAGSHVAQQQSGARAYGTSGASCGSKCGTAYSVRSGDTLSAIGARYGVPWQWIYNANRATIGANPNLIHPGQVLTIPCNDPGGSPISYKPQPGGGGSKPGKGVVTPHKGCDAMMSCGGQPPTGCGINRSCEKDDYTVEVHKTKVIGNFAHHLVILLKSGQKTTQYYRGGPENGPVGSGSSSSSGSSRAGCELGGSGWGYICAEYGNFEAGTPDYGKTTGSYATAKSSDSGYNYIKTCLESSMQSINKTKTQYNAYGPNSNSVVYTGLADCGLPTEKPSDSNTPGWGMDITSNYIDHPGLPEYYA